jgi:hypothetical protein
MRLGSVDRKRLYEYTLVYSIFPQFSSYSKSVLHLVGLMSANAVLYYTVLPWRDTKASIGWRITACTFTGPILGNPISTIL